MITVNGNKITDADNLSLAKYLSREGYDSSLVAVECNGSIVPKAKYEETVLYDGYTVEVVSFVGGG